MGTRYSQTADRVTLEVEFDQHHGLFAYNPPVMARLDRYDVWSFVLHDATVGVFDVNFTLGKEADVRVHAQVGPHRRLHVDRPAESDRVDHALNARRARTSNVNPNAADFSAVSTVHDGIERIFDLTSAPNGATAFPDG